jgi:predicted nucleotidyltransferase component of viral defense system
VSREKTPDIAASVRRRLLNIIRDTGDEATLVWSRYATERLLYRISVSDFADDFVLKGAMLFMAWTGQPYRPTVDIDLLGHGDDSAERAERIFRAVCRLEVQSDGLTFDPDSVKVVPIREAQQYKGQRVTLTAFLGKARMPVQVDIGFGDVVTPRAKKIDYPTILDFPKPRIRAYPRETVVAEKLQAMVMLGIANSRMKDFYDLYVLSRDFAFDGEVLSRAIRATFKRRKTEIPREMPMALTDEFERDETKSIQWKAFIRKGRLEQNVPEFPIVLTRLRAFLLPVLGAALGASSAPGAWSPRGRSDDKWTAAVEEEGRR